MYGNGCVSECLYNVILVHRLWTVENDVYGLTTTVGDNDIIRLTCPSHQDSSWGAAEASQERVIVEVVRKAIVVGKCWSLYWTYLQMFSVSTVLGEKASYVEQSWGASAKLPGLRAPPLWSGRGLLNERVTYSELTVLLFVFGVCMGGWEWMREWMFVFTMPFLCAASGP